MRSRSSRRGAAREWCDRHFCLEQYAPGESRRARAGRRRIRRLSCSRGSVRSPRRQRVHAGDGTDLSGSGAYASPRPRRSAPGPSSFGAGLRAPIGPTPRCSSPRLTADLLVDPLAATAPSGAPARRGNRAARRWRRRHAGRLLRRGGMLLPLASLTTDRRAAAQYRSTRICAGTADSRVTLRFGNRRCDAAPQERPRSLLHPGSALDPTSHDPGYHRLSRHRPAESRRWRPRGCPLGADDDDILWRRWQIERSAFVCSGRRSGSAPATMRRAR